MKRVLIYTFLSVFGASFAENTGAPVLGASTSSAGGNVRLTNDTKGGYVSIYTLATGVPYTDSVLSECAISRGRQNEPSVAVNPRDPRVIIGSSNDYCGLYQ